MAIDAPPIDDPDDVSCPDCDGSGACPACDGDGEDPTLCEDECPDCHGTGDCPRCLGSGMRDDVGK